MNGFLKIFKNTAGFLDFKHSTILKSVYIENRKDFAGKFRYLSRGDEKICFVKDNYVFKIIFTSLAQFKTICEQFLFLNLFFGKSFNCNIIYIVHIEKQCISHCSKIEICRTHQRRNQRCHQFLLWEGNEIVYLEEVLRFKERLYLVILSRF